MLDDSWEEESDSVEFAEIDVVSDLVDVVSDLVDVVSDLVDVVSDLVDVVSDLVDVVSISGLSPSLLNSCSVERGISISLDVFYQLKLKYYQN